MVEHYLKILASEEKAITNNFLKLLHFWYT